MLERSALFFLFPFAFSGNAEQGAESVFLPASNTPSITLLLASRFVAEMARVYAGCFVPAMAG